MHSHRLSSCSTYSKLVQPQNHIDRSIVHDRGGAEMVITLQLWYHGDFCNMGMYGKVVQDYLY